MQKNKMFNFDYSYLSLPNQFHSLTKATVFPNPEVILLNKKLCKTFNIEINNNEDLVDLLLVKSKLGLILASFLFLIDCIFLQ